MNISGSLNKVKQRIYQKRWGLAVLFAFVVCLLIVTQTVLPNYFLVYFDQTGCLPYRVFFWHKSNRVAIQRDDYILGKAIKMLPYLADGERIGKQVKGIAGDTVEIKNGIVKINGQYLTTVEYGAKKYNLPNTHWDTVYTLQQGELFLYGTSENSYDSRYWGAFPQERVLGIIEPVF
ncbi:MAG: S26 family signal peptidase [Neisseriaceae bacterium]|nr:S26 family signal peptidase [Neisseriaceae bacterium]